MVLSRNAWRRKKCPLTHELIIPRLPIVFFWRPCGTDILYFFIKHVAFLSKNMCGQQIETLTPCKHGNISDSSCSLWLSLYSAHQINFSNRISKFRCQVKSLESGFLMKKTCTNSKNWATYTNFMCLNKFFSHCYNLWFGESHFWNICVWQLNYHLHKFVGIPKSQTLDASAAWDFIYDHASFRSNCYLVASPGKW